MGSALLLALVMQSVNASVASVASRVAVVESAFGAAMTLFRTANDGISAALATAITAVTAQFTAADGLTIDPATVDASAAKLTSVESLRVIVRDLADKTDDGLAAVKARLESLESIVGQA